MATTSLEQKSSLRIKPV